MSTHTTHGDSPKGLLARCQRLTFEQVSAHRRSYPRLNPRKLPVTFPRKAAAPLPFGRWFRKLLRHFDGYLRREGVGRRELYFRQRLRLTQRPRSSTLPPRCIMSILPASRNVTVDRRERWPETDPLLRPSALGTEDSAMPADETGSTGGGPFTDAPHVTASLQNQHRVGQAPKPLPLTQPRRQRCRWS